MPSPRVTLQFLAGALLAGATVSPLAAQSAPPDSARKIAKLAPIAVTAARVDRPVFRTASPLLVVDTSVIRQESPNGVADLFRNLPGVDVTGVGPNQTRLMIRGQRGQRILLSEDGVRLNNPRRQQDFGELPALTDINEVSRVEIVRGPASVLYGTDAIGGVVNQITLGAPGPLGYAGPRASVGYRFGSAGTQNSVVGRFEGRVGRLGIAVSGRFRDAAAYRAPAGTFGKITLGDGNRVHDTGVRDGNGTLDLRYDLADHQSLTLRATRYEARDAGFGYMDPGVIGDTTGVLVRLLYPRQTVSRVTAGYHASGLASALADRLNVTAWSGWNDRTFDQQIDIPFGDPFPTGAGIAVRSRNLTNTAAYGFRTELTKVLAGRHTLVYGVDGALDRSDNSDSSTTTMTMFGPPAVTTKTTPTVPNASLWSGGAFAQGELRLLPRFTLGLGARVQQQNSSTRTTPGLPADRAGVTASNTAIVGGASGQFQVSESLNLFAAVGRAFRTPNLVERYFDGVTAEGNGYLVANPALKPETSLNADVGIKFRRDWLYAEVVYFSNTISDGVRIVALGTKVGNFPAYQNQNVARIRDQGLEALAEAQLGRGFAAIAHYTRLDSRSVDQSSPLGDSYSSKLGGELSWRDPTGRLFLAYEVRHQGERKDILLTASPVGDVLPAFTIHTVRGSIRLPAVAGVGSSLGLTINNLGNKLYSEASNTSFFRPEAGRSAILALRLDF